MCCSLVVEAAGGDGMSFQVAKRERAESVAVFNINACSLSQDDWLVVLSGSHFIFILSSLLSFRCRPTSNV